jgi:hypothetical protein
MCTRTVQLFGLLPALLFRDATAIWSQVNAAPWAVVSPKGVHPQAPKVDGASPLQVR